MKPYRFFHQIWALRPPSTWTEVFATIATLLLIFLAAAFLIDALTGTLP